MSKTVSFDELMTKIRTSVQQLSEEEPEILSEPVKNILNGDTQNLWEVANHLGNYYNRPDTAPKTVTNCRMIIDDIRAVQGEKAMSNAHPTTVVFGTSGWRGVIGEDFTLLNVHKVVRGIIEMMQTDEFLKTTGLQSFDAVRDAGVLVFRDNRFMGDVFMEAAINELAAAGIRIYKAGECPTGVGSALLVELGAAGSVNFTPSHNPMEYAGIKFNPADGGPADKNLTVIIEEKSNAYMVTNTTFKPADETKNRVIEDVNAADMFKTFIENNSEVFDLQKIREWLSKHAGEITLVIDFMHGASRGFVEALLGENLTHRLKSSNSLDLVNTNQDYSFHGVKPEPNSKNQKMLIDMLQQKKRRFTLAVAMDPDADRIRYADAEMDIDMNCFGAIAYAHLLSSGFEGNICSTLPSSDFALEIARSKGFKATETAVGFKHFRKALKSGEALLAFEESDGISVRGHTLEKCALAGFLLALDALRGTGKTLTAQYKELQKTYGYYYPSKSGSDVKGISVEAWQSYKAEVLHILQHRMFKPGEMIDIGTGSKAINEINTTDGVKLIFADKSWILLRPSGTEPKFRYYFELVSESPLENKASLLEQYEKAASDILNKARLLAEQ